MRQITTSDGPVSGPGPETNRPIPILNEPKPIEDRIITDRAITSDGDTARLAGTEV